jgi:hypothetical protein
MGPPVLVYQAKKIPYITAAPSQKYNLAFINVSYLGKSIIYHRRIQHLIFRAFVPKNLHRLYTGLHRW